MTDAAKKEPTDAAKKEPTDAAKKEHRDLEGRLELNRHTFLRPAGHVVRAGVHKNIIGTKHT